MKAGVLTVVGVFTALAVAILFANTVRESRFQRAEVIRLRAELDDVRAEWKKTKEELLALQRLNAKGDGCWCGCGQQECKCAERRTDKPNPNDPWCKSHFGVQPDPKKKPTGALEVVPVPPGG